MAIDSAAKRISTTNLLVGMRTIFADGSITQTDRQATARIYSGILSQTTTIVSGGQSMSNLTFIFDD